MKNIVKNIEVKIREDLFEKKGVKIEQVFNIIDDEDEFRLYGGATYDREENKLEGCILTVRASFCDEKGRIMLLEESREDIRFEMNDYASFTISCLYISQKLDVEQLDHIQIYPYVERPSGFSRLSMKDYFMDGMK